VNLALLARDSARPQRSVRRGFRCDRLITGDQWSARENAAVNGTNEVGAPAERDWVANGKDSRPGTKTSTRYLSRCSITTAIQFLLACAESQGARPGARGG
jgi:hypothetical protein